MPTVECKLTDCRQHGREICISKRISIDGVGMVECYDPIPKTNFAHHAFKSNCHKTGSGYKSSRAGMVLK